MDNFNDRQTDRKNKRKKKEKEKIMTWQLQPEEKSPCVRLESPVLHVFNLYYLSTCFNLVIVFSAIA